MELSDLSDNEKFDEDAELDRSLRQLEKADETTLTVSRSDFYDLVLMLYRSEQMSAGRMHELKTKYKTFGAYVEDKMDGQAEGR